jgi:FMN phosphatase YigB (HAD superfamily)
MVGDSLSKDIEPALALAMKVTWFCKGNPDHSDDSVRVISSLERYASNNCLVGAMENWR